MVLASWPVVSESLFAALPVGASFGLCPQYLKDFMMQLTVVVLPVPGHPS